MVVSRMLPRPVSADARASLPENVPSSRLKLLQTWACRRWFTREPSFQGVYGDGSSTRAERLAVLRWRLQRLKGLHDPLQISQILEKAWGIFLHRQVWGPDQVGF